MQGKNLGETVKRNSTKFSQTLQENAADT